MEAITQYKAKDGKIFDTEQKCLEYENLIDQVNLVLSKLDDPEKYKKDFDFDNGKGYIQHDPATFLDVKKEILGMISQRIDHHIIKQAYETYGTNEVHHSWVSRILGDYGDKLKPLHHAWYRMNCIDSKFREWGQPYYATNPEYGKQVQLNPALP